MAKIHDLIEHCFGPNMTEADLLEAFKLEHRDFNSHPMASAQHGNILVHGDFHSSEADCSYAGRFERSFYRAGGYLVAHHQNIFVVPGFRRRKIAFAHITKLIRFYDPAGVEYVILEAVGYGPLIWPQFGFELREPEDVKRLRSHYSSVIEELGYEIEEMPETTASLALTPKIDGVMPGLEALSRTYESLGRRPIPMILDLRRPQTRTFLSNRGIL